jgi:hypothetical protein
MLQTEHKGNQYAKPVLARSQTRRASPGIPNFPRVYQLVAEAQLRDLGDAGGLTLDEFEELYGELRDTLAFRQLSGQALSPREAVMLAALNELLDQLLPEPTPLPKHVTQLVDEVLRQR